MANALRVGDHLLDRFGAHVSASASQARLERPAHAVPVGA
jgi:hypothetical protein